MQPPSLPLAMLALSASVGLLFAESVPPLINYQGRLTDAAGTVLPDGPYRVAFRLWDDPAASATNAPTHLIWGREHDVTLIQGAFNVILGNGGGIAVPGAATNDLAAAFASSNRFLGLTITRNLSGDIAPNQQREILPRQQILSGPYALRSERAAMASDLVQEVRDVLTPPGTIVAFGGSLVPIGWLLCDGSAVSSSRYPRLFTAISTNWGRGTLGTTNDFNLPDLRGLFLRGVSGLRADEFGDPDFGVRTNSLSGGNLGNAVGSIQADAFQDHKHLPINDFLQGDSGALVSGTGLGFGRRNYSTGPVLPEPGIRFSSETRPKNAYVNYIIKY